MTLILSIIHPYYAIIACDKKITSAQTKSTIDRYSNKMLLVLRKNGLFAISYTGLARVHGIEMDRILASCISGRDLSRFQGLWWTKMDFEDIGLCLLKLKQKLEETWANLSKMERSFPFQVVATGYQFRTSPAQY